VKKPLPVKTQIQVSKTQAYLGVMSGTSLDGVDIVAASFSPKFEILARQSFDMPVAIKTQILELCSAGDNEIEKMGHLDIELAQLFALCCNQFIANNPNVFDSLLIRAIGLHGQTIRHRPYNLPKHNFSLQIGDANTVAELTNITTVADFRRRDMAAGGQGAPLVPAFHQSLFQSEDTDRVIVNIGGMSNITLLSSDKHNPLIGFDTGPGNVLIDAWINKCQNKAYDKDGYWAQTGIVNNALLSELLALDFFKQHYPKSTGREQFNLKWLDHCINQANCSGVLKDNDIQASLVELTARTIADQIIAQQFSGAEIFICGGGAHNHYLMQRLSDLLPKAACVTNTSELNLDPDWVEAAAFAWLAKQTLAGLTSNYSTVTGAKGERILGAIYQS